MKTETLTKDQSRELQRAAIADARRVLSKTDYLFLRTFAMCGKDGKFIPMGGAVDTCEGTSAQWSHLDGCGYSAKTTKSGKGILGHPFARKITEKGSAHLREIIARIQ